MLRCLIVLVPACGLVACGSGLRTGGDAREDTTEDTSADVGADVPAESVEDTQEDPTPDITVDLGPDTGEDPVADVPLECDSGGVPLWGICWYLGDVDQSCNDVCYPHDGVHEDMAEYVGTPAQGGSPEECAAIFEALGYGGTVNPGYRDDGLGLGCHRWNDGVLWWLDSPDFDPAHSHGGGQLVCGCNG